ncbi:efflux RND transporter permease subunit [Roseisolibacter agri]|uniref:Cation transporter n=1 Tax=Roseisolibacter agri TaxID=2014610 RepID=A0AA37QD79_9BACT|nr:CusA/CzcA family heavy metal efflux RND transporter [Roseisolibacter agri]GLC28187.1 cation transporter [Roseisolibacter agri]
MRRLISFVLQQRLLVLALTMLLVGVGVWSAMRLPIDAVPDVTNVQVQVNTNAPALSPVEVERQITLPVELAMFGLPRLEEIRSISKFGLSQVTVVFEEGTDIYFARQQVQERLQQAREEIPEGFGTPAMGPISSGLGEIFQYTITGRDTTRAAATELRTLQDWVVAPQLRGVPGVAEVNSFGGFEKQYQVLVRPDALVQYELTLQQVLDAVAANNTNAGGGYITRGAEQLVVRGVGQVQDLDAIRNVVVTSRGGAPVRVGDIADVVIGATIRQGAVTKDGRGEAVTGIVMMRMGSNSRTVVNGVKERFATVARSLPAGVRLTPFYDRTELVDRTIKTVEKNLVEGAVLVVVVLFVLLGNLRAALIVALAIPLSMLFAVSAMVKAGIAGSLMSLGAIDFGLVVDGSVVMVENSMRRLGHRKEGESFLHTVLESCAEVARPILFGVGIIIVVYLPILTLEGVEGKMFKPMALTVVFALVGSLLLTFLLTPVLIALLLRGKIEEKDVWLIRKAKRVYEPALEWTLAHGRRVLAVSGAFVVLALAAVPFLGTEFIPRLDEGSFAIQVLRLPSVSLEESVRQSSVMERRLRQAFPNEIADIVSKTGRAEIATDPMGVNISDVLVMLTPHDQWTRAADKADLERQMGEVLGKIPGLVFSFSQPIELRVNELIAGVRSDLAIKIYGDDLQELTRVGDQVVGAVSRLPGATGFKAQQLEGLPQLQVTVLPDQLARYGINAADVMRVVEAVGGAEATTVLEGQRRFALTVRFPESARQNRETIVGLLVNAPGGQRVPLGQLARVEEVQGPAEISHENGSRLLIVEGNVRGRDIGSFVADVRALFDDGTVKLPPGYRPEFGGQFENLERASRRLFLVVPLSLLLIFLLLFTTFNSVRQAALVFTGIPLATVGGIAALLLRGMPFSISAGVGFIALFGVAVLNGVVMVSYINELRQQGLPLDRAVREGGLTRLRPVLTTALVASLGFIPMAISTGAGAEVQQPLATVVIGGLVTSTLLTLLVLPLLYSLFEQRAAAREERAARRAVGAEPLAPTDTPVEAGV